MLYVARNNLPLRLRVELEHAQDILVLQAAATHLARRASGNAAPTAQSGFNSTWEAKYGGARLGSEADTAPNVVELAAMFGDFQLKQQNFIDKLLKEVSVDIKRKHKVDFKIFGHLLGAYPCCNFPVICSKCLARTRVRLLMLGLVACRIMRWCGSAADNCAAAGICASLQSARAQSVLKRTVIPRSGAGGVPSTLHDMALLESKKRQIAAERKRKRCEEDIAHAPVAAVARAGNTRFKKKALVACRTGNFPAPGIAAAGKGTLSTGDAWAAAERGVRNADSTARQALGEHAKTRPDVYKLFIFCYWLVYSRAHITHRMPEHGCGLLQRAATWQAPDAPKLCERCVPPSTSACFPADVNLSPMLDAPKADPLANDNACFRIHHMQAAATLSFESGLATFADRLDEQLEDLFTLRGFSKQDALACFEWLLGSDELGWSAFGESAILQRAGCEKI